MGALTEQERYVHGIVAQMLAERVVQKLLERQKQALVVYTGSNMGIGPGLECLRKLRLTEGFSYRVLLTRSASGILDVPAIRSALEPEELWVETPGDSPEALTARYDTILVPALTVNTAAHVAACMADTPAAAIILDGLMRGKNVVVAVDGCCPDNPQRVQRGFRMTEPLKKKLRENRDALKDYGAFLTTADRLGETALKAILSFAPQSNNREQEPSMHTTGAYPTGQAEASVYPTGTPGKGHVEAGLYLTGMPGARYVETGKYPADTPETRQPGYDGPAAEVRKAAQSAGVFHAEMEGRVFSGKHIRSYPDHATVIVPQRTIITQLASDEARRRGIRIETAPGAAPGMGSYTRS